MLLGRPWIHDIKAVPSSLYQKVRFPHKGAIVTIYGDTLTVYGFEIEKLGFERRIEEVEKIPMDFNPYGNNNVVAMMRKMRYFSRMSLGKAVKEVAIRVPTIPTATPPFELGYKPIDDNLLDIELRKMACAKSKAMGLLRPTEPLNPYILTLNRKFVKAGDSQRYWGFLGPRYDPELKIMLLGFELLLDCDNKLLEVEERDTD